MQEVSRAILVQESLEQQSKTIEELTKQVKENPVYGERYHVGERISTGFTESAVNHVVNKRFSKKQQIRWSKSGAHLLLQTRTRVLSGDLEKTFERWCPGSKTA